MKSDNTCELTAEMKQEVKKIVERKNSKNTLSAIAATAGAMLALLGALHLIQFKSIKVIFLFCKDAAAEAKPETKSEAETLVDGDAPAA